MAEHADTVNGAAGDGPLPVVRMRVGYLPLWGGFATLAMILAMGGSAWPTAYFFLAGWIVPIPVVWGLCRLGVSRVPRLSALAISLVLLGSVAWIGKHPPAGTAFSDVTGVPLPPSAIVLRVERGWYDGRTTIVWFKADPETVRALTLQVDGRLAPSARQRIVNDDMRAAPFTYEGAWQSAVGWVLPVSRDMGKPPPWASPRASHWMLDHGGGNRLVYFLWDEATGEAIVFDGTD